MRQPFPRNMPPVRPRCFGRARLLRSCLLRRLSGYAAVKLMKVMLIAPAYLGKRSEEHTPELQSLMRISYAVFCLKKKNTRQTKCNLQTVHNTTNRQYHKTTNA